jgi:hypothetical protein
VTHVEDRSVLPPGSPYLLDNATEHEVLNLVTSMDPRGHPGVASPDQHAPASAPNRLSRSSSDPVL